MHPKEARKIKNGTGRLTHLNLQNSELIIDVDFTHNKRVNEIINTYKSYVLYPDSTSIDIAKETLPSTKNQAIFIIDATWASAKKMLRLSTNLQKLPKISFTHTSSSKFQIKEQPFEYCLSTMESVLKVLEYLQDDECYTQDDLKDFLYPFEVMNTIQLQAIEEHAEDKHKARFRKRD